MTIRRIAKYILLDPAVLICNLVAIVLIGIVLFAPVIPAGAQSSAGGDNQFHLIAANSNNSTLISAGQHAVHGVQLSTIAAAPGYLKLYDKATAPTCGTDTPTKVIAMPAAATAANGMANNVVIALGTQFSAGLGICVVTGIADSDNTSVASASFNINIDWK